MPARVGLELTLAAVQSSTNNGDGNDDDDGNDDNDGNDDDEEGTKSSRQTRETALVVGQVRKRSETRYDQLLRYETAFCCLGPLLLLGVLVLVLSDRCVTFCAIVQNAFVCWNSRPALDLIEGSLSVCRLSKY